MAGKIGAMFRRHCCDCWLHVRTWHFFSLIRRAHRLPWIVEGARTSSRSCTTWLRAFGTLWRTKPGRGARPCCWGIVGGWACAVRVRAHSGSSTTFCFLAEGTGTVNWASSSVTKASSSWRPLGSVWRRYGARMTTSTASMLRCFLWIIRSLLLSGTSRPSLKRVLWLVVPCCDVTGMG